ncbi:uncharacterized protein LOC115013957 [Cottoperca gobio]|uniref:Uncharacterized protein LOC115013957 n=1 Tax=Cottoperca gobio TaxID=56716 RepID=A0A6J2QEI2_COTGO|nr:uncharacterized protein LOC115013957 [Cottoperca gobio]
MYDQEPQVTETEPGSLLSHSEAIAVVLEEMGRKQTEISTWPLTSPEDAGRHHAALSRIQNVLIDVLTKQHSEKDLAQKYRSVSDSLRQRVLKLQLVSLASRQRKLVEILKKQMHLVEVYVTMKAKLSTQPANHQGSTGVRQQPDHYSTPASKATEAHSCDHNSQRQESRPPVTPTGLFRPAPPNNAKDLTGHWHLARVLGDGSIKDSKGKMHLTPECWLESILGNNIPVSSTYAWDKSHHQINTT